jgi:crossover junction endodeoxyribonuclease RuvC
MVVRLLGLPEAPDSPDAADALALALCHLWGAPLRDVGEQAGAPGSGFERAVAAALARDSGTR